MLSSSSRVQQFILHAIPPILCSILVGYLFFHAEVFDRYRPTFQFVWSAVVASVFYNLLISVRSRDAWLGLVMLFFFTLVTTHSTRLMYIFRDILYVGGIAGAVLVYLGYFKRNGMVSPVLGPLVLAGLFAAANMMGAVLNLLVLQEFSTRFASYSIIVTAKNTASFGVLIGFGIGVGIVLTDKFLGAMEGPADVLWPTKIDTVEAPRVG